MAQAWKSWESHTPQWRARAYADGMTKTRWNNIGKLSKETRAKLNFREYAAGKGVAPQRNERERRAYLLRMGQTKTTRFFARHMTQEQVRIILKATPEQLAKWRLNPNPKLTMFVNGKAWNLVWYR